MKTDTPRTDEAWAARQYAGSGMSVHVGRQLERELTAVTEQRDRLAEALEQILEYQGRFAEEDPQGIAREALQSLTTNPQTSEKV